MATLGSIFAGSWLAAGGGEKPKTAQGPPINASSKDEENFIQYVHVLPNGPSQPPDRAKYTCSPNCSLTTRFSHRNFMKEVDGGEKKPAQH